MPSASRRALLRAHVSFAVLAATIAHASAVDVTIPEGTTQTTTVNLGAGDTLTNRGTIQAGGYSVTGNNVTSIDNSGLIQNAASDANNYGIGLSGNLGSLLNSGDIIALGSTTGVAFGIYGDVNLFDNSGLISGGLGAVFIGGTVNSFINSGEISGLRNGVFANGGQIVNSGTLLATAASGDAAGLVMRDGVITNSGTISGRYGILSEASSAGGIEIINSGRIEGTSGVAIDFGFVSQGTALANPNVATGAAVGRDDILRLLPGSVVVGSVDFGEHVSGDLLDLSQFTGTLVLDTTNLELIQTAGSGPVDFSSFTAVQSGSSLIARDGGQIAIVDAPTAAGGGDTTAATIASVTGEISAIISSQLSGIGAGGTPGAFTAPIVNAYAPQTPDNAAATAVLTALDVGSAPEPEAQAWASVFGGLSTDTVGAPLSSVFGGIVAGSHAIVAPDTRIGVVGGYVRSLVDLSSGAQQLDSHTGIAGVYGQTKFDSVTFDLSLLSGFSAHHSDRDSGGLTAAADFSSWFLAPEAALTIPVLSGDGFATNITTRAKYVGGVVAGYTETGGLVNLTIGDQPISLLDLRAELNGHVAVADTQAGDVLLFGSAGVFAQSNLGGSTVPVTMLGQTINAVTPGTTEYGVYGTAGITVPLTVAADFSASLGGSARSDGLVTAVGKLQLTADF